MNDTISPCRKCLMIPACRNKDYLMLMDECSILHKLLYVIPARKGRVGKPWEKSNRNEEHFRRILNDTQEILKPTSWHFDREQNQTHPLVKPLPHRKAGIL